MKPATLHPGFIVRREIIEPCGLTIGQAAHALGVGRPALSNFLNGKARLSPEMAIRLEKAFGCDALALMLRQMLLDIELVRMRQHKIKVNR